MKKKKEKEIYSIYKTRVFQMEMVYESMNGWRAPRCDAKKILIRIPDTPLFNWKPVSKLK